MENMNDMNCVKFNNFYENYDFCSVCLNENWIVIGYPEYSTILLYYYNDKNIELNTVIDNYEIGFGETVKLKYDENNKIVLYVSCGNEFEDNIIFGYKYDKTWDKNPFYINKKTRTQNLTQFDFVKNDILLLYDDKLDYKNKIINNFFYDNMIIINDNLIFLNKDRKQIINYDLNNYKIIYEFNSNEIINDIQCYKDNILVIEKDNIYSLNLKLKLIDLNFENIKKNYYEYSDIYDLFIYNDNVLLSSKKSKNIIDSTQLEVKKYNDNLNDNLNDILNDKIFNICYINDEISYVGEKLLNIIKEQDINNNNNKINEVLCNMLKFLNMYENKNSFSHIFYSKDNINYSFLKNNNSSENNKIIFRLENNKYCLSLENNNIYVDIDKIDKIIFKLMKSKTDIKNYNIEIFFNRIKLNNDDDILLLNDESLMIDSIYFNFYNETNKKIDICIDIGILFDNIDINDICEYFFIQHENKNIIISGK